MKLVSHFHSPFFELYDVINKGVYAAIVKPAAGGLGNAGFIDLGDGVLVIDTFLSPRVAEDLKRAIDSIIGKPVKYVVNTHWHSDHTNGNQVFKDAIILSTKRTRELMIENNQVINVQEEKKGLLEHLRKVEEEAARESDKRVKQSMLDDMNDKKIFAEDMDVYCFTPPSLTFETTINITGLQRSVEIVSYGGGHSESDAFVYLKDESLAFVADLIAVNWTPFIGAGNPIGWLSILDKIKQLNIKTLIPGHGPVGSTEHIDLTKLYIHFILNTIRQSKAKGLTVEEVLTTCIPEPFNSWEGLMIFNWNIQMLWEK